MKKAKKLYNLFTKRITKCGNFIERNSNVDIGDILLVSSNKNHIIKFLKNEGFVPVKTPDNKTLYSKDTKKYKIIAWLVVVKTPILTVGYEEEML